MKKYACLLLALLLTGFTQQADAQGKQKQNTPKIEAYGDLYLMYNPDQSVRIIAADKEGNVQETNFKTLPSNLRLHYYSAADSMEQVDFEFSLHPRIKHSWRQTPPEKTLVVSDLHGRLDAFVALLKGNGVVDENLNWSYGKNQLVFVGDILDRGRDDIGIAWLVYKLEQEAENAGGRVDFLMGNHEDLVLRDDIRYVHEDHLIFAAKAAIPYFELLGPDTELGRWIRDSYLILVLGDNLFVHAGLSLDLTKRSYKIGEINELAYRFVGYPTNPRKEMHSRNEFFFGNKGPFWYRGLVFSTEAHPPISKEDLDKVLKYYKIKRIIVGHSEVDEVELRYEGKVIPVNVRHYKNFKDNRTAGLLIENGQKLYSVNYTGDKTLLQ